MPRWPDFTEQEYQDRLGKAQNAMRKRDLDALLLTEWENIYYISDFNSASFALTRDWPTGLIVKKDGDSTLVLRDGFKLAAVETSWVPNIQGYRQIGEATEALKIAFAAMGLKGAKVGAELGETQAVKFSTGVFLDLIRTANVTFVDGSPAIWDLRMIKSRLEVDRIEEAAKIASRAAERAFMKLTEGMTEREFSRLLGQYMMEEGADWPRVTARGGEKIRRGIAGISPGESKFQKGEYVQVDFGATYRQYASDINRTAVIGRQPTIPEKDHWNLYVQANQRGTEAVRPGATAAKVFSEMARVFEEAGIKVLPVRFGHGLGLDLHEPPNLGPDDKRVISAGMVLAIEPFSVPDKAGVVGSFNCEDDVVCTETGAKRLSTIGREIFCA